MIREIKPQDNEAIEQIIRGIFPEFEIPLTGSTYADKEVPIMYESYQGENKVYYILEDKGAVVGGAGIKPVLGTDNTICELRKMYFMPKVRGKGYGKLMFDKCLRSARVMGYKQCYLESASQLNRAIHMYEKNGFKPLDEPLYNSGHFSCGVWMIKDLL